MASATVETTSCLHFKVLTDEILLWVIKMVCQGEGQDLLEHANGFQMAKEVIDDMATDATMFDVNKSSSRRAIVRWRFLSGAP